MNKHIELNAGTEYKFSIGKDKETQGDSRFELGLKPAPIPVATGFAVTISPNPATDEVKITFTMPGREDVNIRIMDVTGRSIYARELGVLQNGSVTIPLERIASGIYMVEFTAGDKKIVQKLVKK